MQEVLLNNRGHGFIIIKKLSTKKCLIKFENTNHIKEVHYANLYKGKCKDPYEPSKNGIGFDGEPDRSLTYWKKARQLWNNMMKRCYSDDPKGYKWKGTKVDKRWHCFANFLEDISKLDNFQRWLNGGMDLDKDSKILGNNIYSKESCSFLPSGENRAAGARSTVRDYKRTILRLKDKS